MVDTDHQQLGIEDEHEGQDRGADVIGESLDAGADGIALGDGGGGVGGQTYRWGVVGENAEIEYKQMHRDQRQDQAVLCAYRHQHRGHQRGDHDVVGGGRQAHAQDQADHGGKQQGWNQKTAGDEVDKLGHNQPDPGQGDGAYHDAGRGRGHAPNSRSFPPASRCCSTTPRGGTTIRRCRPRDGGCGSPDT